jgi:TetR/AcrR family transcriptional regulator, transcriptional repressor for nem operon
MASVPRVGRPRSFDEDEALAGAARLFAAHGYDGTSVDDLVRGLGVHRGSLYSTFGSKRALYLRVLREHVLRLTSTTEDADLTLLLRAAVERAPVDPEAAVQVRDGLAALGQRLAPGSSTTLAELLGQQLIRRAAGPAQPREKA